MKTTWLTIRRLYQLAAFLTGKTEITPRMLDWAISGVPVYIYRNAQGEVYASIHDFGRFKVEPLEIVRVPVDGLLGAPDAVSHALVKMAIAKHVQAAG